MQVPIPIRYSKKCERCGLRYPSDEEHCEHCFNLSDKEVDELKSRIREEQKSNMNLGRLFFYICILFLIGILVMAL